MPALEGLLTEFVESRDQYCAGTVNAKSTCCKNGANFLVKSGRFVTELIPAPPQFSAKSKSRSGTAILVSSATAAVFWGHPSPRSLNALFRL